MPEDYLWDRSGQPDPQLLQIESSLSRYRHQPRKRPTRLWLPLAIAASLLLLLFFWPSKKSTWTHNGTPVDLNRTINLTTDQTLQVANIGRVTLRAGSRFRILQSDPEHHRMELLAGSFDAFIIAPPYVFQVVTPPAHLDDLGCAYEVSLTPSGNGNLKVKSGWVSVNSSNQQSLVRQGYEVDLIKGAGPSLPRPINGQNNQDVLHLAHLLWRGTTPQARATAFDQLAALHPPPPGVTRDRALRADPKLLTDYWPALNLGPTIKLPRIFYE
jgi:ferric-dicitrate binding protein FerR (iron transport regulator)